MKYFSDINLGVYSTSQGTCGNFTTIEDDFSDYNDDRLSVLFHTNRNRQNRGFFMVVTCVSPDFNNVNGCTPAQLTQPTVPTVPVRGRRKRVTVLASSHCGCYIIGSMSYKSIPSDYLKCQVIDCRCCKYIDSRILRRFPAFLNDCPIDS